MEIEFRDLASGRAAPGEVWVRPADPAEAGRRDLASYVLERGVAALLRGEGAPRRIVVAADPTLDDLLAAAFVERSLEGALPPGAAACARYAALQREGLHPGDVPIHESIEGVFLAQRNAHGDDLTDPSTAARFAADWRRTAAVLLDAAGTGADPFRTRLFGGPEFARERAFLAKDREVYRQDVLAGERFVVRVPGGPPRASALLLRRPKSLLAKHWARSDPEAPVGGAYLVLGVLRGTGEWVFSTDPVQRLPIRSLAERLQAAEARVDPDRASADPWFDGRPFGHTLVASPRGGSRLADDEVSRLFRRWAQARRPHPGGRRAVVAAAIGGAVLAALVLRVLTSAEDPPFRPVDFADRGAPLGPAELASLRESASAMRGLALLVAVGANARSMRLPAAVPDTARVYRTLRDRYGFQPDDMVLLVDEPERALEADGVTRLPVAPGLPDLRRVSEAISTLGDRVAEAPGSAPSRLVFYFAGHGDLTEPGGKVAYLQLSGYTERRSEPRELRGYDMAHLTSDLRRKVACPHQLLLIDCCYSGFTVSKLGDPSKDPSRVYELWGNPALAVITAGSEEEKVGEDDSGSYFATVLLEALGADGKRAMADGYRGDAEGRGSTEDPASGRDGIVTDAELGVYLRDNVYGRLKRARLAPQTPLYFRGLEGDDVGQFLLFPR